MSIEFHCPQCEKLLRVPEGTAGKSAKCPECGALTVIPAASAPERPVEPPASLLPSRPPSSNPFEPPGPTVQPAGAPTRSTLITLNDVYGTAWEIFQRNVWQCAGVVLLMLVGLIVMQVLVALVGSLSQRNAPAVVPLLMVVMYVVILWVQVGFLAFMLKITRGQPASFNNFFECGPRVLPTIAVMIIVGIAAVIAFLCLIIPYFIVMPMLSPAILIVLDKPVGIIDSLRHSKQITEGNKLTLVGLWLITSIVGGVLNCCGILSPFVVPFTVLVYTVAYLRMMGEPTAVG